MEHAMFGSRRADGEMALRRLRTVRFHEERSKATIPVHQKQTGVAVRKLGVGNVGKIMIFVPNHEPWYKKVIDPASDFILIWNYVFFISCFIGLFMDPLYFYVPKIIYGEATSCVGKDRRLAIIITVFRSLADLFYVMQIVIKFMTAYINPSSTLGVFGRGDLVTDPNEIAKNYFKSDFVVDLVASVPVPQIITWSVIPHIKYSSFEHSNEILFVVALFQYVIRLYLITSLNKRIVKVTGAFSKTAWQGAFYNLLLYMTASHVLGSLWYLLSVDRQTVCWKKYCSNETSCHSRYLACDEEPDPSWLKSTRVFTSCDAGNKNITFDYGMFQVLLLNKAPDHGFLKKYLYCLWWGLQNLSCCGQTLSVTTTYIGETLYAIFLAVTGLVLFAHLIGNVQTYLQSITARVEEWRVKQTDTEEWMRHRQLPHELRERVRRFIHYRWLTTRGVDEASILKALPADLRRDINRHLCLDLVRRVPFFSQMDDQLLDAICGLLVSSLSTKGTYIVREGDPVTEMLFIIRGKLESSTTDGGRTGFFNSIILKPGDFSGEELLGWALVPRPTVNLPSSTRTVKALIEVEAFALQADDLKFVASQFRRLHSKKLQHTFHYYSHHWKSWAACFIQASWRRYKRRKLAKDLIMMESLSYEEDASPDRNLALKIMTAAEFRKPSEPDFSVELEE